MLLLTMSSLPETPSPGPPRLKKTPAAVHPLPQRGEGHGSEGVLSVIRWDRTVAPSAELFLRSAAFGLATCEPDHGRRAGEVASRSRLWRLFLYDPKSRRVEKPFAKNELMLKTKGIARIGSGTAS